MSIGLNGVRLVAKWIEDGVGTGDFCFAMKSHEDDWAVGCQGGARAEENLVTMALGIDFYNMGWAKLPACDQGIEPNYGNAERIGLWTQGLALEGQMGRGRIVLAVTKELERPILVGNSRGVCAKVLELVALAMKF